MTEKEFRALLAVEGYTLNVDRVLQKKLGTPYVARDMYCAEIIDSEGCVVQYSNDWYPTKAQTIQALIREYYCD